MNPLQSRFVQLDVGMAGRPVGLWQPSAHSGGQGFSNICVARGPGQSLPSRMPRGSCHTGFDGVEGGLQAEESARFTVMLADARIDLIDVSGGAYESMSKYSRVRKPPKRHSWRRLV